MCARSVAASPVQPVAFNLGLLKDLVSEPEAKAAEQAEPKVEAVQPIEPAFSKEEEPKREEGGVAEFFKKWF